MISTNCEKCGWAFHLNDTLAGRRARCKCGASIRIPAAHSTDGKTETARALEQAVRAMEGKLPGRREAGLAAASSRRAITRRQWVAMGAIAGVVMVGIAGYGTLAPGGWESEHRDVLMRLKAEGDQLASQGKARQAVDKYGQVIRLVAGVNLRGGELKKTVAEAASAREALASSARAAAAENGRTAKWSE